LYQGGFALHALLMAAVLAEALLPGPLSRALAAPPLRSLGRISYGVYLYHWPVFLWLSRERFDTLTGAQLFVLRTLVTLAIAIASFHFLERPVRTARRGHVWWPRVAAPIALASLVLGAVVVRPPAGTPKIVFAPISKAPPPKVGGGTATRPGAPVSRITAPLSNRRAPDPTTSSTAPLLHRAYTEDRPLRVMVVGDSVGQTFGRGVELWGMHTGRAQVWNDAHFYCALGRYAPSSYGTGEEHQPAECDAWGERWPQEVQSFDPDVVLVLYTFWEMVSRKPPGVADFVSPGDPAYDAWQMSEYVTAVDTLSARGAKVVWLTAPCRQGDLPEHAQLIGHLNDVQIAGVARRRPDAVRVVDLHDELCPDNQFHMDYRGVAQSRPDGAHFSDAGAEAVADWVMGRVLAH
jgi:hypothetical protein